MSANIAGGTHHAFRNRGEGFCLFNDVAVASFYALEKYHMKSEIKKAPSENLSRHCGSFHK